MSQAADILTLFDLRSQSPNQCWSANTWKIRLILNYKGIPYRTQWIEYADIESEIKQLDVAPNPDGQPGKGAYTVPAVTFPDGHSMMDSAAIANEIERRYPNPSVLNIPAHSNEKLDPGSVEEEWLKLHRALATPTQRQLLAARSVQIVPDYSRLKKLEGLGGKTPEEIEANINIGQAHQELEAPLSELGKFWLKHMDTVRVPDKLTWFAVHQLSALKSVSVMAPDVFRYIMNAADAKGLQEFYATAEKNGWFERKDY